MKNLIENGKQAQEGLFNMKDYESLRKEFSNNSLNPIHKICEKILSEIEEGKSSWEDLSRELQLMYFGKLEFEGMSSRIFFYPELDETHPDDIKEILDGNFLNKIYVQKYYDRFYA